ncbi:MAG: DUF4149 domain-containing protein [Pyrinomonadaceae bacterium]
MKFFSNVRLLVLAIWLGSAVFFISVAQSAFAVVTDRELAGAVVGRNLMVLNLGGIGVSTILLLTSLMSASMVSRVSLWTERFLLLVLGGCCAVGQFVIGVWLGSVRSQMAGPIDTLSLEDPLRMQFNMLHQYSMWVMLAAMIAALIAFFIIANRQFHRPPVEKSDVYDFSKEFKT